MSALGDHQMLFAGTLLFLLGLLTGVAIPALRNKRMGLSAHLVGVQHGIVLWVVGLIQARLTPSPTLDAWMTWSLVLGLYGLWLAMLLAAIWGASRARPAPMVVTTLIGLTPVDFIVFTMFDVPS